MLEALNSLAARVEALLAEVAGLHQSNDRLAQRIDGLREDHSRLATRQTKSEGRIIWIALGLIIAVVLAVGIAVTAVQGIATAQRVDKFCPLLALSVGSYDPSTRKPEDRPKYEAGYAQLRKTYEELGCSAISPLIPPRKN